jgi:hypothetical protein
MDTLSPIERIRKALSWVIFGLLGTVVLVNIFGFLSPFWAMWRYETAEELAAHSRDVLELGRLIGPWFSLLFLYGSWHLGQAAKTNFGRWTITIGGALVSAAYIARLLLQFTADSLVGQLFSNLFSGFQFLSLLLFLVLVWRFLRSS